MSTIINKQKRRLIVCHKLFNERLFKSLTLKKSCVVMPKENASDSPITG